jgi:hypothetical protein
MMAGMSERDRRVLVAGGAVILLILLLGRGIPAWRRWDEGVRAEAEGRMEAAARAEAAVRDLPAGLDSLEARRERFLALGGSLLEGESPAAAGAALAGLLSGTAARAGVQLGSVQVRPDTAAAGAFLRVWVRADATGDLPSITRMLTLLEGAPERLRVRELSITQPSPGGPAEQPEALRVEVAVEGLALARGGGGPPLRARPGGDSAAVAADTLAGGAPAAEEAR